MSPIGAVRSITVLHTWELEWIDFNENSSFLHSLLSKDFTVTHKLPSLWTLDTTIALHCLIPCIVLSCTLHCIIMYLALDCYVPCIVWAVPVSGRVWRCSWWLSQLAPPPTSVSARWCLFAPEKFKRRNLSLDIFQVCKYTGNLCIFVRCEIKQYFRQYFFSN